MNEDEYLNRENRLSALDHAQQLLRLADNYDPKSAAFLVANAQRILKFLEEGE